MTDLKPCPFCGEMPENDEGFVECFTSLCPAEQQPCTVDRWNSRAVPELPEGYREEVLGSRRVLMFDGLLLATQWTETGNLYVWEGLSPEHFQALAIWLQRRAAK